MSAAAQTKIFGIRLGVDPKILVGGLIAVSVVLFWYNSRSDEEPGTPASAAHTDTTAPAAPAPRARTLSKRRAPANANDRATLRLRTIDATSGDVDPTLRLDLMRRLETFQPASNPRNLFEAGPAPEDLSKLTPIHGPKIVVPPPAPTAPSNFGAPAPPVVNIPLKYYGFVKPMTKGDRNRGFFLDGDSVVIALEGQVIDNRYLVVELTQNTARLEDTQMKQGQTLQLIPEAAVAQ